MAGHCIMAHTSHNGVLQCYVCTCTSHGSIKGKKIILKGNNCKQWLASTKRTGVIWTKAPGRQELWKKGSYEAWPYVPCIPNNCSVGFFALACLTRKDKEELCLLFPVSPELISYFLITFSAVPRFMVRVCFDNNSMSCIGKGLNMEMMGCKNFGLVAPSE